MADTKVQQLSRIRLIKISDLNKREILKAYQNRDKSIVYELKVSSWKELAKLDDNNDYKKSGEANAYDATLISIFLKEPEYCTITYSDLKYLLSFIYNLRMSDNEKDEKKIDGRKVFVCFRQECNGSQRDYFRLSAFLKLWAVQNEMFDNIIFYDQTNNSTQANPKHLAAEFDSGDMKKWYTSYVSGSSFPIISINEQVCQILDRDYLLLKQSHKEKMAEILSNLKFDERNSSITKEDLLVKFINSYLYAYIEKSLKGVAQEDWQNFINKYKPSLLVATLFATIANRMIDKKNKKGFLSGSSCIALTERCYSYAQGILQLIENANEHVVKKGIGNSAFLGFWLRDDKTAFLQSNTDKTLDECEYFLEMFVVDCDFSDKVGIISQYNQTLHDNGVKSEVKSLKEVFDFPATKSDALEEYYRDTNHIAFHYGLQIFSGVVSSSKGFLKVVSGNECYGTEELSKITFCNNKNNYITQKSVESNSSEKELHNFSGTSYVILLPTSLSDKEEGGYNYFLGNVPIGVKLDEELNLCTIIPDADINFLISDVLANCYNDEQILNIDLRNITQRKQIELACKKLLVKLVQKSSIKTLCLTGFKNEYSLLDAVRVISLFYNKLGEFKEIKSKGIFLYCRYNQGQSEKDKEYELYFNGSSLQSVKANIYRQKLVKDVPDLFLEELEYFLYKDDRGNKDDATTGIDENFNVEKQDKEQLPATEEPLSAAIIKYYLKLNGNDETIIQKQIKDILSTDIHEKPLGCKISNTHVRIGKVHLDTFYEAQFLFGNAYCTDIFALYVADRVKKTNRTKEI